MTSHIVRYAPSPATTRAARHASCAAALALSFALPLALLAHAVRGEPIYKCVDAGGRVTYQSDRCSNGEAIDIAPGAYDEAAAQRLRDDAAEWNKRDDARRTLAAQQDALRRERQIAVAPAAAPVPPADCTYCDGWNAAILWPYVPWRPNPRPPPPKPPPPKPPYIVIR